MRRSCGAVCRYFDEFHVILKSDTSDDFRQLILFRSAAAVRFWNDGWHAVLAAVDKVFAHVALSNEVDPTDLDFNLLPDGQCDVLHERNSMPADNKRSSR